MRTKRGLIDIMPLSQAETRVRDPFSKTVPELALPLRDLLMQFGMVSGERLSEICNRGFDGANDSFDEAEEAQQMDIAEIHERISERINAEIPELEQEPEPVPEAEPATDADA